MDRNLWNVYKRADGKTMRERTQGMGCDSFDVDKLIQSALGDKILETSAYWYANGWTENSPGLFEYWEKQGLRKTLHDNGVYFEKWASYVPTSAYLPENRDRKYPVIFVLHGGASPIYDAEIYGFNHLAAEKEIIIIMPQDRDPEFVKVLRERVIAELPADPSRMYCTGFSAGGGWCMQNAAWQPELFAACAPCGVHVMLGYEGFPKEEEWRLEKYPLPIITVVGVEEGTHVLPYNVDDPPKKSNYSQNTAKLMQRNRELGLEKPSRGGGKPNTAVGKIEMLNRRLRTCGCHEVALEDCLAAANGDNIVNKKLGAVCDKTEDRVCYEQHHYIGSFFNAQGKLRFQAVGVDNVPHMAHYSMAEIVWDFFSRFRRGENGELIED